MSRSDHQFSAAACVTFKHTKKRMSDYACMYVMCVSQDCVYYSDSGNVVPTAAAAILEAGSQLPIISSVIRT